MARFQAQFGRPFHIIGYANIRLGLMDSAGIVVMRFPAVAPESAGLE